MTPTAQAEALTARLGYEPRDLGLFVVGLTHRSAEGPNNERLEFLGDSVLNLLLSERLYREFPTASEGDLSRLRARL
ncbi:MAG: ribonuclease III, partial [Steroidobacteraceae bacterium]|nr:ribonuclease III [Steroidobacteraceae bacterium]